jgi:hypothetical protein
MSIPGMIGKTGKEQEKRKGMDEDRNQENEEWKSII